MTASPLSRLRLALFHALGLTAAASCGREPLTDAGTASATTSTSTTTGTTSGPATLTADPDPITTGPVTTGATTGTTAVATTDVDLTTTTAATGPVEPETTTGTTTTTTTTTTTGVDTTGTTGQQCVPIREIGTELMPADVMEIPGCEDLEATECFDYIQICVDLPDGLQSCDECAPDCIGQLPEDLCAVWLRGPACGPFAVDEQCCHVIAYGWNCGDGRPFLVDGTARTADPTRRRDWLADAPGPAPAFVAAAGLEARAELAALWTADALAEHASVASFARFTLHLLALGAPPALVQDAAAAGRDEVVHARLTFALAAQYAGAPVGPGPLALDGALDGPLDLVSVVVALVREGCVGETLAAAELDLAARTCEDPALAATLRRIAADEQRHAALAWRTLQWALGHGGPALRRAAADAFALRIAASPPSRLDPAVLRRHGRLPADERAALAAQCLRSVILPCARALLGDLADAAVESARA